MSNCKNMCIDFKTGFMLKLNYNIIIYLFFLFLILFYVLPCLNDDVMKHLKINSIFFVCSYYTF